MALTLVVENGTGLTNSNSYATIAEAETYFEAHLYTTVWDIAINKDVALVMATRLLDDWIDWEGYRATEEQSLRWPRHDVVDEDGYLLDSDVVPQFLKNATAELAQYIMSNDPGAEPDTVGFSSLRVGELAMTIDKNDRDRITAIPDVVKAIIEHYGNVRSRSGEGSAKLLRV